MSALKRRKVSSAIGPTRENEFFRSVPPVRITSIGSPGQFGRDVHGIGDDRQILKIPQRARNRRRRCARVKNQYLSFLHFLDGAFSAMRIFS